MTVFTFQNIPKSLSIIVSYNELACIVFEFLSLK